MSIQYREFTFASSEGLQLFCREYAPEAPAGTVLCLPGLTRNSRDFEKLARRLAARYRVLTPDFRGRGRSQWDSNPANYHPGVYAQDVLQLIGQHASGRAGLIGTSLGGLVSMLLAAYVPATVACTVLNDVGPEIGAAGVARISGYVGRRASLGSWEEAAAQAKANYAVAFPDFTDEDWRAYARASYREDASGAIVADYDPKIGDALRSGGPGTPGDVWALWAQLRQVPILAVRGATSDVLTEATFDRMLAEKPDLMRVTVPGRGHPAMLDEPAVTAALDAFLARHLA